MRTRDARRSFPLEFVAAALVLIALAGICLWLHPGSTHASEQPVAAPASVAPQISAGVGAFRRAATPADVPTAVQQGKLTAPVLNEAAADFELARRVVSTSRDDVWLVPGTDAVCVSSLRDGAGGSGGCASLDQIGRGYVVTTNGGAGGAPGFRPHEVFVVGVVPDGVASVTLNMKDADARTLAVNDNTFSADVFGDTDSISFVAPDGAHRVAAVSCSDC
jgi:hypothetical protein